MRTTATSREPSRETRKRRTSAPLTPGTSTGRATSPARCSTRAPWAVRSTSQSRPLKSHAGGSRSLAPLSTWTAEPGSSTGARSTEVPSAATAAAVVAVMSGTTERTPSTEVPNGPSTGPRLCGVPVTSSPSRSANRAAEESAT